MANKGKLGCWKGTLWFNNIATEFKDYEWMMEEGADEKLEREIEEQLKFAELERMMLQEEAEAGDLQVIHPYLSFRPLIM